MLGLLISIVRVFVVVLMNRSEMVGVDHGIHQCSGDGCGVWKNGGKALSFTSTQQMLLALKHRMDAALKK